MFVPPSRLTGLKSRIFGNLSKTSPVLVARILLTSFFFLPGFLISILLSWRKIAAWRKKETCAAFIRRYRSAFPDIDENSLSVESISGGVSNSNQVWRCRRKNGEPVDYFVKVFLPVGSFWARHLCFFSPFPVISGGSVDERFTVDMMSRVQLADRDIPVPKLVAYGAVEKVMVTEYLKGETVDEILRTVAVKGATDPRDERIIAACGRELARVHNAGLSLIDTQPVNCIWMEEKGKVFFTDLEFSTFDDKHTWDAGFFLSFLLLRLPEAAQRRVRNFFLNSYRRERSLNLSGVADTRRQLKEYLPVLRTILDIRQYTPEELFGELMRRETPSAENREEVHV